MSSLFRCDSLLDQKSLQFNSKENVDLSGRRFYLIINLSMLAKNGDTRTVVIPVTISARLEKVAWISLFSTALDVPIA